MTINIGFAYKTWLLLHSGNGLQKKKKKKKEQKNIVQSQLIKKILFHVSSMSYSLFLQKLSRKSSPRPLSPNSVMRSEIKPRPPAPRADALTTTLCGGGIIDV